MVNLLIEIGLDCRIKADCPLVGPEPVGGWLVVGFKADCLTRDLNL